MNAMQRQVEGLPGQLHFDLTWGFIATGVSAGVKDHMHAITSKKVEFHPEDSRIGEHTFSIKLSYMGRSFLVTGNYRRETIRSYSDATYTSTQIRGVKFETISAFRNGRYIPELLPKKETDAIEHEVVTLLGSPFYNNTLADTEIVH